MSAVGDELQRRKDEQRDARLATALHETRLRLFDTLERFDFESREIHPMEKTCNGGPTSHPLGWVFHVRETIMGEKVWICDACYRRTFGLIGLTGGLLRADR